MHGGNRLGGNSLSDLIVFGRLAGIGAVEYAKGLKQQPALDVKLIDDAALEMTAPFERLGPETAYDVHADLQVSMQANVGIFRTESDIELGIDNIAKFKERAAKVVAKGGRAFNPGWHLTRELKNMLVVSEAIALSALHRRESRAAHSRLDYPDYDPELAKFNSVVRMGPDGAMVIEAVPKPPMPDELVAILAEQKELQPVREENKKVRLAKAAKE